MVKLRIDIQNGILEVEGEENLVREIYQDFKEKVGKQPSSGNARSSLQEVVSVKKVNTGNGEKGRTTGKRKESYQIVKDLDLSGKGGKESLKAFYAKKGPKSAQEKNAVFVYFLEKHLNAKNIGANHVYTCYKDVGEKVPGALRQSLLDTSSRKGWIDTKSMEDITLSTHGENLVEHSLSAEVKSQSK